MKCPTLKFWVKMDMENYIKKVEDIPGMKEWIANFRTDEMLSSSALGSRSDYFTFDVALSQSVSKPGGGLVALGPIIKLHWPNQNRICVPFIPKGMKFSTFFRLMPKPGTFEKPKGDWAGQLRKLRLSEAQVNEWFESLTRCGKYRARIKHPFKEGQGLQYTWTVQGPGNDLIVQSTSEFRIIPGFSDVDSP